MSQPPAPPAPAGFAALCAAHLRQRQLARTHRRILAGIASDLATLLHARLHSSDPVPYDRWRASLGISKPTSTRLLALLDPRPQPPAATLANSELTIQLDPYDASLLRRVLPALPADAPHPCEIITAAIAASQPDASISGARGAAALPPLQIPSPFPPLPGHSPPSVPIAAANFDHQVRTIHAHYQDARRARTLEARELNRALPALARHLADIHASLASPGCAGRFCAFLRRFHIPRRTAYCLMEKYASPNCAKPPVSEPLAEPPSLTLTSSSITLRLSPRQTAIVHAALTALIRTGQLPHLGELTVSAFLNQLPNSAFAHYSALWHSPHPPCRPNPFLRPLQIPVPSSPLTSVHQISNLQLQSGTV
ncbi:MAG: hypothetical protein ACRD1C_13170 [Terriglobales bacterium]